MAIKNEKNLLSGNEEELKKQWEEDIRRQDFFQKASEKYNATSVDSWLRHYISDKYISLKYLDLYEYQYEKQENCWIDSAQGHLELIQQKKLFDLQCRWRAEQVRLPGVEICYDFDAWEHDVLNCPFLDPITSDELELYIQYLHHADADPDEDNHMGMDMGWQDYEDLHESVKGGYAIPEWYEYHNLYTGAGSLLTLPDIRGAKERKYTDLTFESRRKELEENRPDTYDRRPWLHYDDEEMLEKVLAYEGPFVSRTNKLYSWNTQRHENEEYISNIINDLVEADEPVPIEAHSNWLEALKIAHRRFQCRMIAACMPQVYEQYCMNLQMGIAFASVRGGIADQQELRDAWRNNVLTGRKLAGEKEDLDF